MEGGVGQPGNKHPLTLVAESITIYRDRNDEHLEDACTRSLHEAFPAIFTPSTATGTTLTTATGTTPNTGPSARARPVGAAAEVGWADVAAAGVGPSAVMYAPPPCCCWANSRCTATSSCRPSRSAVVAPGGRARALATRR